MTSEKHGQKFHTDIRITTQIWVVHLIGRAPWEICFSQKVNVVFWESFRFFFLRGIHVWQYYNLNQVTSLVHVTGNCNVWFVNGNSSICSGGSRPSDKGVPRHPDPDIRWWGGPGLKRKIFQLSGPSVWSKNKGGLAPLDPPLVCDGVCIYHITV